MACVAAFRIEECGCGRYILTAKLLERTHPVREKGRFQIMPFSIKIRCVLHHLLF